MKKASGGDLNSHDNVLMASRADPATVVDRELRRKKSEACQHDQQRSVTSVQLCKLFETRTRA